jgi:cold shock CspA family protein
MKGRVASYISNKKYGFITGEDGESYFLHYSNLSNKNHESRLSRGVVVNFEPTPVPKGLSASCVDVPEVFFTTELVDFFMTKNSNPKFGQIEKKYTLRTRFIQNPNSAREFIKYLAIDSGCNAILNLTYETDTFSEGNYQYTVFAFQGDFAVVTTKTPCASKQQAIDSLKTIENTLSEFDEKFLKIEENEIRARKKQFKRSNVGYYIALTFAVIMTIIGFMGTS